MSKEDGGQKISTLKRILHFSPSYRKRIYKATGLSILNKIFDLAPPLLIGLAVDTVVSRQQSFLASLGFIDLKFQLLILALATFVVWGLESLFEYMYKIQWRNLAQDMQHDLRVRAFGQVLSLDLGFFENKSTGELLSILNDDVNQLERFLDTGANDVLQVLTTVIIVGGIFVYLVPGVTLFAVLPIPFILLGSFWFQKKLAPKYSKVRQKAGEISSDLANVLSGVAIVKSYTAEQHELTKLEKSSRDYCTANNRAIKFSSAFSPLIRMVIVLGFTVTLVMGGIMAAEGSLNIGSYSSLVYLIQRLLWPLTRLGQTFDLYQRAMASARRIFKLIDTKAGLVDTRETVGPDCFSGDILFENVSFSYPNTKVKVSDQVSFKIPGKNTIGIVGTTGSGKSTLVKMLLRFYEPQSGVISIGGFDTKQLSLAQLRKNIALVSQEVYLFHGSVKDNICYGSPNYSENDFIHVCKLAEIDSFVQNLPDGYNTLVGERGQKLSGGQRQRISLARALLKNAPILLLDEATSAIDNETEAAIQRSLNKVREGRTVIVIAHRLSTIRSADKIIVLENGKVAEEGSHSMLTSKNGIYSRLWKIQTGDLELQE